MSDYIRVENIDPGILRGPYALGLARAVEAPYLRNGAMSLGVHLAPADVRRFYLTAIVDETSPDRESPTASLMVQGGTQFGCQARQCGYCVYAGLPFYRQLTVPEIVDSYRLALFLHHRIHPHAGDRRRLALKFTDNGEPLLSPALPEALECLTALFGRPGKVLRLKISTVLYQNPVTGQVLGRVMDWQRANLRRASIHLQISRPVGGRRLWPAPAVVELIRRWARVNPRDCVCVAPGFTRGHSAQTLDAFLRSLAPVANRCFVRLSVLKPSTDKQRELASLRGELEVIQRHIEDTFNLKVDPLPQNSTYCRQLETAGTLSHLPNGKLYDPASYRVLRHGEGAGPDDDPNTTLP